MIIMIIMMIMMVPLSLLESKMQYGKNLEFFNFLVFSFLQIQTL